MNSTTTCEYILPMNASGTPPTIGDEWAYSASVCVTQDTSTTSPGTLYVDTMTGGEVLISFFLLIYICIAVAWSVAWSVKYNLFKKYMGNNTVNGKEFYDI